MKGVLIDLDGVVYQNDKLITGADTTVNWLQEQNIPHLFLTNTTSKPVSAIVEKLAGMGINVSREAILTPAVATVAYLTEKQPPQAINLLVPSATRSDFDDLPIADLQGEQKSDAVIVGDLGEDWSYTLLNNAFRQLMDNDHCQLIALGMTRYWRGKNGLQLDAGPFVKALSYASGKDPLVMGKPAASFFQQAASRLNIPARELLMVGDDAKSDIGGAQNAGIQAALVKTGKFRDADLESSDPDFVIPSFADLADVF